MPPPYPSAELPETVLLVSVSVPTFLMPPPEDWVKLPETVLLVSVRVPLS